jgi:hypothetical protein
MPVARKILDQTLAYLEVAPREPAGATAEPVALRADDRLLYALPASMAEEFVSNLNTIIRAFSAKSAALAPRTDRVSPAQEPAAEREGGSDPPPEKAHE